MEQWAYVIYGFSVFLLVCVLVFGKYAGGSRRWLGLGVVSIQPSEFVKLAVIVMLARYYARVANVNGLTFYELFRPFVVVAVPFMLIVRQPDLGTAMVVLLIAVSMTLFVKVEKRLFVCLGFISVTGGPLVWFCLKGYQKQRILTFLNPDLDPLGAGYHIIQSKIAIGSGMFLGRGLGRGPQNALSFLPEQHTDFIFSVLAEELGFAGSFFMIFLFLMLVVWGLNVAHGCREPFGTIVSVGVTAMIFWQVFINVAMVTGLMPVVGVPLPFISYGGSSVITVMMCVGVLMNVSMRRFLME
ncbi:Peptidoglycan glycosyltransferase [Desulfonema magnum]|uniref:Cell wall polymerase n=1 Tax=Desulfonema magnum TaxID=45655 RepID=A0A975GTK5_9BACT|nr:Peptidoglycan glycosyltransferase [Desulfonema magnum]